MKARLQRAVVILFSLAFLAACASSSGAEAEADAPPTSDAAAETETSDEAEKAEKADKAEKAEGDATLECGCDAGECDCAPGECTCEPGHCHCAAGACACGEDNAGEEVSRDKEADDCGCGAQKTVVPQFKIEAQLFIDGDLTASPKILTMDKRPFTITTEYDEEQVFVMEARPEAAEDDQILVTGTVHFRDALIYEIDESVASGEILELSMDLDDKDFQIHFSTTRVADPESDQDQTPS